MPSDGRVPLPVKARPHGGLAWWSAVRMLGALGVPQEIGLVGITATTGVAAWIEYALLRRAPSRRIGRTGPDPAARRLD